MLVPILIFDLGLVAWSLHLMQQAFDKQEFSLAAVAMLVVYFLMGHCLTYLTQISAPV